MHILVRVDRGGAFADILLDRTLRDEAIPDPRDRALLTELVMGTLRRRGTLDFALSAALSRPLDKTDVLVRNALRLGAYQLFYLRVPERAALFETVASVKARRGAGPAGLVNAVLRKLAAYAKEPPLPDEEPLGTAVRLSVPLPLLSSLGRSLGDSEASSFLESSLAKPPFVVRANTFRASREELLVRLAGRGMEASACRFAPDGIVLGKPAGVHADADFLAGDYLVMDEGAQLIAPLLSPREGEGVLDACAAPGGKTTHLAALSRGKANVVAADVSPGRARILEETVARAGAPHVAIAVHDFAAGPLPAARERFDKVLVDAPCTGIGVIRRNPDAKWRFRPGHPAEMARLQRAILANAWVSLRKGGLLVYCTCSPLVEEDEEVAAAFLAEHPDAGLRGEAPDGWPGPADAWTADGFVRLSPHRHGTDGFFAALIRKGA